MGSPGWRDGTRKMRGVTAATARVICAVQKGEGSEKQFARQRWRFEIVLALLEPSPLEGSHRTVSFGPLDRSRPYVFFLAIQRWRSRIL